MTGRCCFRTYFIWDRGVRIVVLDWSGRKYIMSNVIILA